MKRNKEEKGLIQRLRRFAHEINYDKFMLMEYLSPLVEGCQAAFKLSLEKATDLNKLTAEDYQNYIDTTQQSLQDVTICFKTDDTDDIISMVFENGEARIYDECVEPDVVINGNRDVLFQLLDSDSRISPVETLGLSFFITGIDYSTIVEGLGLLCFPPLLRVARSGIDPTSLLSEDADSVIIAAASDLVTNLVNKWVSQRLSEREHPDTALS
ncbi:MAG: hypothetical protein ACTSUB_08405 [Candidatus Thorarchaeota archaeon]